MPVTNGIGLLPSVYLSVLVFSGFLVGAWRGQEVAVRVDMMRGEGLRQHVKTDGGQQKREQEVENRSTYTRM